MIFKLFVKIGSVVFKSIKTTIQILPFKKNKNKYDRVYHVTQNIEWKNSDLRMPFIRQNQIENLNVFIWI